MSRIDPGSHKLLVAVQEAVAGHQQVQPGPNPYPLRNYTLLSLIFGICLYALASFGILRWTVTGPVIEAGHIVLRTGKLKVDQLYSGLALSFIFLPAAIMTRRIANRIALIQPFAVSARKPVAKGDLDRMMDPGVTACATLSKYSVRSFVVQALLTLVGAILVPVGTLLITTGQLTWAISGTAVTGIAVGIQPEIGALDSDMELGCNMNASPPIDVIFRNYSQSFTWLDDFNTQLLDVFLGSVVAEGGTLAETPALLGPSATPNISMHEGVTYHGVVTYTWDAACEYTNDIPYTLSGDDEYTVNFTWPDGTQSSSLDIFNGMSPFVDIWSDGADLTGQNNSIPLGNTTYFAVASAVDGSSGVWDNAQLPEFAGPWWISRVKWTPVLDWQISSCTWFNGSVTNCTPAESTVTLDHCGLNGLTAYLRSIPHYLRWAIRQGSVGQKIFGLAPLAAMLTYDPTNSHADGTTRVPVLADYTKIYGAIARSIAAITTNGYYGVANIPTTGSGPRPVYIVRMYIFAIIIVLLLLVPVFTAWELLACMRDRLPVRDASFLTIASAVRGSWWDDTLSDGYTLSGKELRKRHKSRCVMFGLDTGTGTGIGTGRARYIGLALQVTPIHRVGARPSW